MPLLLENTDLLSESSEENKLGSASSDDEELGLLTESDDDETPVEFDGWGSLGKRAQRVCIYCPCCLLGGVVQLHIGTISIVADKWKRSVHRLEDIAGKVVFATKGDKLVIAHSFTGGQL